MKRLLNTRNVIVAIVIAALPACSYHSSSGGCPTCPSPVTPQVPPEWQQPNSLVDPSTGVPADFTVSWQFFSPPIGSRVITWTGGSPPGNCPGNGCFQYRVELCNKSSLDMEFVAFWSADGMEPVLGLYGTPANIDRIPVSAGQCVSAPTESNVIVLFSPGSRQVIWTIRKTTGSPGAWNPTWPKSVFNFDYQH